MLSMLSWSEFVKNSEKGTTRIESSRKIQIEKNKHYLKTLVEVVLLCPRQDHALRGHRESEFSLIFLKFLN